MKYAVPTSGNSVATRFGHCEQFALVDVDGMPAGSLSLR